ncbi:AbaSI family restriction endonuclease [Streptococcus suis]|uniref:Uncharacterized protein n=2 Tax=Streptococcus suis TaxID=1307 RepID=A0A426T839_STRSU|nr:hypothetical protein [Streptococcus suis]RRR50187.1 hypothetical protein EJA00_00735 [Streptococcus suis]HEL2201221.1 hypothetical protein [Streptococcus suis]HEL2594986.1 hypothetical protein [Streptococcus suis]HEM5048013.1 hypothetical protein [Streptococcus suis]HEM5084264.1 hypothetical protein [Streptococcus suis]
MARTIDELTYYAKLLSKLHYKKYEFYVVSRIIHLLNDSEIQFTTQQVVRKSDGKRYLIDLYFPQFRLAVEVDEEYHKSQIENDQLREREVVAYANVDFKRIDCSNESSLETVHEDIDNLVNHIRELKNTKQDFVPYSYAEEFSVEKWKKLGTISVDDNAKFKTHVDVLKLFGKDLDQHQRGTSPLNNSIQVWFPKLYDNGDWKNSLSEDGTKIFQSRVARVDSKMKVSAIKDSIVFAHQKDVLGNIYYTFKGVYRCIKHTEDTIEYERISSKIFLSDYL